MNGDDPYNRIARKPGKQVSLSRPSTTRERGGGEEEEEEEEEE